MIITEYTKDGKQERQLTTQEIQEYAKEGNIQAQKLVNQAKKEIYNLQKKTTIEERLLAIEKYLELI
jgi:N-acetylglucosamine kinase-like BadF-type ATPase